MYILYTESTLSINQLLLEIKPSPNKVCFKRLAIKPEKEVATCPEILKEVLAPEQIKGKQPLKSNPRFKTEKCRHFYEFGHCEYGNRCMFAHGLHELRAQEVNRPHYKTRICTTFQFDGYCSFGSRCAFVHVVRDPIEVLESTLSSYPRIPMPENLNKCRPEFYPSDILTRRPNREMLREEQLLVSSFSSDHSTRLSTFVRLTNSTS